MLEQQKAVEAWHKRVGHPAPASPEVGTMESAQFRADMILEEAVTEYLDAVRRGDLIGIADSIGDGLWILLGTAVKHGLIAAPIFDEVCRSNFSKFDADGNPVPHPTIPGKIGKSELYQSPNLGPIVAIQVAEARNA